MYYKITKKIILACLIALGLSPSSVSAEVDCTTLSHWVTLDNGLQMNQKHLFCGEWKRNRPKGFHSRPGGIDPVTIARFTIQDSPNTAGIYTSRWSYRNHANKNKFSSMFPDNCSIRQVLYSIAYASENPDSECPRGSPHWTKCGQNKPRANRKEQMKYCSKDGELFTIGFAPPRNGRINTAFPIYQ